MKTLKRITSLAVLAVISAAAAGPVYVTAHGKTYHSKRECMSLARAAKVYTTTPEEAAKHNLKPCGICNRPPAKKKSDNAGWAKEAK